MWSDDKGRITYDVTQDKDVTGMMKQCNALGPVCNIPEVPGLLVFMKGHVGVYIGKGKVIEAKGHAYGVVQTELKKRPWELFGRLGWLEYIEEEKEMLDGKIVAMITRLCDKYGEDVIEKAISRLTDTFIDDGNPSGWAVKEVEAAKELGLTDGSRPEMFATRQEVMMMNYRTYKKIKETENGLK